MVVLRGRGRQESVLSLFVFFCFLLFLVVHFMAYIGLFTIFLSLSFFFFYHCVVVLVVDVLCWWWRDKEEGAACSIAVCLVVYWLVYFMVGIELLVYFTLCRYRGRFSFFFFFSKIICGFGCGCFVVVVRERGK